MTRPSRISSRKKRRNTPSTSGSCITMLMRPRRRGRCSSGYFSVCVASCPPESCLRAELVKVFAAITSGLLIFPWASLSPNPGNSAFFKQLSELSITAAFRRGECDAELVPRSLSPLAPLRGRKSSMPSHLRRGVH